MASSSAVTELIRVVLRVRAGLHVDVAEIADSADLYQAGMSSLASVNVMLGLEEQFAVEFPDRMIDRAVFASVASIRAAVEELVAAEAAMTGSS